MTDWQKKVVAWMNETNIDKLGDILSECPDTGGISNPIYWELAGCEVALTNLYNVLKKEKVIE